MSDFDYKKYSLEKLETWVRDAVSSAEASPQEIYETITKVVKDEYSYFKNQTSRLHELLSLLDGFDESLYDSVFDPDLLGTIKDSEYYEGWHVNTSNLTCDKNDKSPECQKAWNDFWEEHYYPQEHSQYSEKEMNEVNDNVESRQENDNKKELSYSEMIESGYTMTADGFWWPPHEDKVRRWILPTQVDGLTGDVFINLPDDLLELANLVEGDQINWVDNGDGSYTIKKVNAQENN